MNVYDLYFEKDLDYIERALKSIKTEEFEDALDACTETLRNGKKIIVSGLGKNVPICDKFVGSMLSMGMNAGFLHTNSAVHGDLGMVKPGDLVIILSKSGSTSESIYLANLLKKREGVQLWLLSCKENSDLTDIIEDKVIINLEHEGDQWNVLPNNSTTINLIILQTLAIELSKRMGVSIDDFKINHPGGAIGEFLKHED